MVSGLGGRDVVREYFGLSSRIRGAYLMDDGIGSPGSFFVNNQVAPQQPLKHYTKHPPKTQQ